MELNKKDNQVHWERFQKRTKKGERLKKKLTSSSVQFLKNLCRATEHIEDPKGYKEISFSDDWRYTIVTYTCSRCNTRVDKKEPTRYTYTLYGTTGRIKTSRSP